MSSEPGLTESSLLSQLRPARYQVRPLIEAFAVALVIVIATFSTTYFIYARALFAQEAEIRQGLLRTANVAASIIDPVLHQSITQASDESSTRYRQALAPLTQMQLSDPQIAYLYTAVKIGNQYHFILDTTPGPSAPGEVDKSVAVMQTYNDAPSNLAFLRAFETQKPTTSDEPYSDEYGRFISGYVPLKDAKGQFYGILGMDIDIKDYEARLTPIRRATTRAFVAGFFIAFLMGSAVWFLRNFIFILNKKRLRLFDMLTLNLTQSVRSASDAQIKVSAANPTNSTGAAPNE
jgi:hypothetical protein